MSYKIKSKTLRKALKYASHWMIPKSANEEVLAADFADRIVAIANEYAREVARKAINTIGRKD